MAFTFIQNPDYALCVLTNDALNMAQGVLRTAGLDLVDHQVTLQGQILGKSTGFLMSEDYP